MLTTSNSTAKLWNWYEVVRECTIFFSVPRRASNKADFLSPLRRTGRCLRTLEAGYGLSACFVPGNRHALIGTRDGHLRLFDIGSGEMLDDVQAHEGAIWSIAMQPDKQGFVSASADKDLKFWEFELTEASSGSSGCVCAVAWKWTMTGAPGFTPLLGPDFHVTHSRGSNHSPALPVRTHSKRLTFVHTRTLKMTDEITAVVFSPDQRLLAVSLLDTTVKVFFADSLKFFLSLFGHKLPVLSMDISQDSTLLATG